VTHFDDVELAALCSKDVVACQAFIADTLGPLASDSSEIRRLRATLETFFALNSNYRATAARLGVHHNTVRYRLERARALLGRAPEDDRLQLEIALHLASRLSRTGAQT
jgi:DNA-binding PucR family transcriptional regulator